MRPGRNEFRELISAPRMHRNRTHRTGTNIAVPDSGRARATANRGRFFTFLFPRRRAGGEERRGAEEEGGGGEGPVTSAGARVILPKGIAPTKEHDLAGEVSGSSLKPGELSPLREPSIVGPLFDCRIGKEYTPRRQTRD